jgi:5-methylcytosine-specific restriction endonuclease McrBC regulatory subunit McrC
MDDEDRALLVADAKWKLLDASATQEGVAAADMYQLVTYARRFACGDVALLYPAQQAMPAGTARTYVVPGQEPVTVRVVGLDLPALVNGAPLPTLFELTTAAFPEGRTRPARGDR